MDNYHLYLKISSLSEEVKAKVIEYLDSIMPNKKSSKKKNEPLKKRKFGSMKGQIKMSKDFDEPLEDFKDYM